MSHEPWRLNYCPCCPNTNCFSPLTPSMSKVQGPSIPTKMTGDSFHTMLQLNCNSFLILFIFSHFWINFDHYNCKQNALKCWTTELPFWYPGIDILRECIYHRHLHSPIVAIIINAAIWHFGKLMTFLWWNPWWFFLILDNLVSTSFFQYKN